MEKSELFMDTICMLFPSQLRSSFVSVVFDFNASLNDVAPVSPISLSIDLMRIGKERIVDGCHLRVIILHVFHLSD